MRPQGILAALFVLTLAGGVSCSSTQESKPKDLGALRHFLLLKAKQKFKHALRITERHSPDPFNQARQQLVYTLIELEEFDEAEKMGREFIQQKAEYLELARTKLAELELDWRKELAGNPKLEGTKMETDYLEKKDLWNSRIAVAQRQVVGVSLLVGEVLLRRKYFKRAIPVFKEILTVKADHNTALRRLGQTYILLGDFSLAAMYLERAHKGLTTRLFELREGLDAMEKEEAAATSGSGEEEVAPEPKVIQSREQQIRALEQAAIEIAAVVGVLHYLTADFPKSDDWFARAFELDPTSYFLDLKLGLALLREGRKVKATQQFEKFRKNCEKRGSSMMLDLLDHIERKGAEKQ